MYVSSKKQLLLSDGDKDKEEKVIVSFTNLLTRKFAHHPNEKVHFLQWFNIPFQACISMMK